MDDQIALKYSCIIFAVTAVVLFVLYLFLRSVNRKIFQRIRKFSSESYLLSDEWKEIYQKNKNKFPLKQAAESLILFKKIFRYRHEILSQLLSVAGCFSCGSLSYFLLLRDTVVFQCCSICRICMFHKIFISGPERLCLHKSLYRIQSRA